MQILTELHKKSWLKLSLKLRSIISILSTLSAGWYFVKNFVIPFIAQKLLNSSSLTVIKGTILRPNNSDFELLLQTELKNTGPLATVLKYRKPLILARYITSKSKNGNQLGPRKILQEIAAVEMNSSTAVPSWGGIVDMNSKVIISDHQLDHFSAFSKDLVSMKGNIKQILHGDGICIELMNGLIQIEGLKLYKEVSLQGLEGLNKVLVHEAKVVGSTSEYMILECDTSIFNPSNVCLEQLGNVYCSLHYIDSDQFPGVDMSSTIPHATIMMENLTLKQGENRFMTRAHFKVTSSPGVERESALKMLSNFICCKSTKPILFRGHQTKATKIPYLFDSLTSLSIPSIMPGLPSNMKMIKSALLLLHSPLSTIASLQAPSRLELLNAFPITVSILKMKGKILHNGNEIASLDIDLESSPIILEPESTSWTREIKLKLKIALPAILALFDFDTSKGVLKVDVESILDCKVGEYLVRGVEYHQAQVSSKMGFR